MRCASEYNKRVVIQQLTGTADDHGHIDITSASNWTTYANAYATVKSKGGREFWKVDQVNADVDHVWRVQWTKTLAAATPDMQLVSEDVTYEILAVIDVDLAHEVIEIQTKRRVQ
jgi:SPP1 family predicted phage head-tail adaptor